MRGPLEAAVHEGGLRLDFGRALDLRERGCECGPVVGVLVYGLDTDYPVAPGRGDYCHLTAELVRLVRLALRDALDLRRVHAVELRRVTALLAKYPLTALQQ